MSHPHINAYLYLHEAGFNVVSVIRDTNTQFSSHKFFEVAIYKLLHDDKFVMILGRYYIKK